MSAARTTTTDSNRVVAHIAAQLGETGRHARWQIGRIVRTIGEERALTFLAQARAVEARGGLPRPGGGRRTPGGVFFHLVKTRISPTEQWAAFPRYDLPRAPKTDSGDAVLPTLTWHEYGEIVATLPIGRGEAQTVKITLTGQADQTVERGETVIIVLKGPAAPPTLPKGVPTPQGASPNYAVLMARKQWQKVEKAAKNPSDRLIIEGYPTLDPRFHGITVLATLVTSKQLQAAQRQQHKAQQG